MLSLQSFLREGRVVGPCWEKSKPKGPKGPLGQSGTNDAKKKIWRTVVKKGHGRDIAAVGIFFLSTEGNAMFVNSKTRPQRPRDGVARHF